MITSEERQSIVDEAVQKAIEKALLILPETIGNLITSRVALNDLNKKFYADHPEFKGKGKEIASVVEMVEGRNPLMKYEEILKLSVPEIKNRLSVMSKLNMQDVTKEPSRNLCELNNNGII